MSEIFTGFPDDDIAGEKLNGDHEGEAQAGGVTPYDFASHAQAAYDGPAGAPEGVRSFIWHYLSTASDSDTIEP